MYALFFAPVWWVQTTVAMCYKLIKLIKNSERFTNLSLQILSGPENDRVRKQTQRTKSDTARTEADQK